MTKQAKKADLSSAKVTSKDMIKDQFKAQEMDLQVRFSRLSSDQRQSVGNYLNAYNLAAWIYNEIIDDDCRIYIDLAMKYTMETQALANSMRDVSEDPNDVEKLVNQINHGE